MATNAHTRTQTVDKMFERDWGRACAKEKFMSMLARENKGCAAGKADKVALAEVHDVLKRHYQVCVALCVDCVCVAGGGRLCWGKTRWCIFDGARRAQALLPSVCGCACVVCSWQLTRTGAERRATANSINAYAKRPDTFALAHLQSSSPQLFVSAFTYYAALGGNDPYHM